jgi:Fungal specific transcription factor domain
MSFQAPPESEPSNASPGAIANSISTSVKEPPTNISYLGRGEYISNDVEIDNEGAPPEVARVLSERDMEVLQIQRCFELPPRAIRESLLDSFWKFCWPWTPIVERSWIDGRNPNETSTLLLQAMMLAGSRVTSSPLNYGNPEDFYKKGKTLFWMASEQDPIVNTVAACLLNWWNPEGPEHVSIDTSGFWLRICVALAYQIGLHREPTKRSDAALRRRLWWSLVVRDSLINAGHGRPRAINLQVSDVLPTTVHDFDGNQHAADLFAAYTGISCIIGDLTQCFLQKGKFTERRSSLGDRVFRWVKTLPDALQLCYQQPNKPLKMYGFEARQLHVQYFTALIIINKNPEKGSAPSTASMLASSFVAGLFEDFLARDELRFLGPIFTFYLLCSGTTLLSSYRYPGLWHLAEQDLQIIFKSQEELSKRWPSAVGSLKNLADVREKVTKGPRGSLFPENNLTVDQTQFFNSFGGDLCRAWDVLYHGTNNAQQPQTRDLMTAGILQDLRTPGSMYPDPAPEHAQPDTQTGMVTQPNLSLDASILDTAGVVNLDTYGGIGNWLFNDWHNAGTLW